MENRCCWCDSKPIHNLKWRLCIKCYRNLRAKSVIDTNPSFCKPGQQRERVVSNLLSKYGLPILDDLEALKNQTQDQSLLGVGLKYGLTRERVRQLFKIYHGFPFTRIITNRKVRNLVMAKESNAIGCKNDPRQKDAYYKAGDSSVRRSVRTELAVFKKCEQLGYVVHANRAKTVDLTINGYLCDVKSCFTARSYGLPETAHRRYYRFALSKKQLSTCDYIIACIADISETYILPRSVFANKGRSIYIPANESRYNRSRNMNNLGEYKDAWHLLAEVKK